MMLPPRRKPEHKAKPKTDKDPVMSMKPRAVWPMHAAAWANELKCPQLVPAEP
jgi:hypothetical protein